MSCDRVHDCTELIKIMNSDGLTYGGFGVVGEPDGGELTPAELALSDVTAGVESIADADSVVASLAIGIVALVL